MAKRRYVMVVETPADPRRELFGGWFPDLPGCFTAGRSIPHLRKMGQEAVSLYLWALEKGNQAIPEARYRADYVSVEVGGNPKPHAIGQQDFKSVGSAPRRAAAAAKNGSARRITVRGTQRGAKRHRG